MTDPLELQRRNMIEYQQIDIYGNEVIIDGESQMPDYLSEKLLLEEYLMNQDPQKLNWHQNLK